MTVILDRGHGINTPGKGSPWSLYGVEPKLEFKEWRYCDRLVDAIATELKKRGLKVVKTTDGEYDTPLSTRVAKANEIYLSDKMSFLVSVHVNAFGDGRNWNSPNYWSVWTSKGQTKSDKIADSIHSAAQNILLGKNIKSERSDGDADFESDFYILKRTLCPAVLTENFFQTNKENVEYLLSDKGFSDLVNVHVSGIMNYINYL